MKSILIFLYFSLILGPIGFAQVQNPDPKAKLILTQSSAKYRAIKTLMANFSFTLFSPEDHVNQVQKGVLWVRPSSNQYHIQFKDQDLICDGKNNYTYLKKQKEVQISNIDSGAQNINPAKIFTLYEKGFTYQYRESILVNKIKMDVIDLVPQVVKKIFKAQVFIDQKTKMIYRIKTFDKNGDQLIYTILSYNTHPQVEDSFFGFDKKNYPGVEMVDLR